MPLTAAWCGLAQRLQADSAREEAAAAAAAAAATAEAGKKTARFAAASLQHGAAGAAASGAEGERAAESELERVFAKKDFAAMRVCGQFNLGFILAVHGHDLFIVDQVSATHLAGDPSTHRCWFEPVRHHIETPHEKAGCARGSELFLLRPRLPRSLASLTLSALAHHPHGAVCVCVCVCVCVVWGQHASDEKFNFERLQRTTTLTRQPLVAPQPLSLTAAEELTALQHMDTLARNGFGLAETADRPAGQRLALTAVPLSKNITFGAGDVQELIAMLDSGAAAVPQAQQASGASSAPSSSQMVPLDSDVSVLSILHSPRSTSSHPRAPTPLEFRPLTDGRQRLRRRSK